MTGRAYVSTGSPVSRPRGRGARSTALLLALVVTPAPAVVAVSLSELPPELRSQLVLDQIALCVDRGVDWIAIARRVDWASHSPGANSW